MKKILLAVLLGFLAGSVFATGNFGNFPDNVNEDNIKYFAKDMGGLLGAGTFTTGRVLGWGGFQVGPHASMWFRPSGKNTALGPDAGAQVLPWMQAGIGFPWRIDGFIRAGSMDGFTAAGGGFRWGILRPVQTEWAFQTMLVAAADAGVANAFSVAHYGASVVMSMTMKYFTPYVSAGVDNTTVTVKDVRSALDGTSQNVWTPRGLVGVDYKLPSYLDVTLAGNWAHYGPGAEASLTLRF